MTQSANGTATGPRKLVLPCMCEAEGYCPRFHKEMHGAFHQVCRGGEGVNLENRALILAEWAKDRDAGLAARSRSATCKHLGGESGVRECPSCRGAKKVAKTFHCAHPDHDDVTPSECKVCPDYDSRVVGTIGGIPDRFDLADHLGLSFAAHARTALYNARDRSLDMKDVYRGATAFFLGGGPSLRDVDPGRLRGRLTLAVNGVSELFPSPTLWSCADPPVAPEGGVRFRKVPWDDPNVLKLVPRGLMGADRGDGRPVFESVNVAYFLRDARFHAADFLSRRTFNWGSDADIGGGRSVMLTSLKLLWWFGVAKVVLLGCDFRMDPARPYAHSGTKDEKGCASNNHKFRQLNERFAKLRPVFEAAGMTVVNATPDSGLTAFDRASLAEVLAR